MKLTRWITLAACAGALVLGGCSKSDSEKAKDKVKDAVEETGDAIEDAGDKIEDALDDK